MEDEKGPKARENARNNTKTTKMYDAEVIQDWGNDYDALPSLLNLFKRFYHEKAIRMEESEMNLTSAVHYDTGCLMS